MEVKGQLYAPAAYPLAKEPPAPFDGEGWVSPTAVLDVAEKRKISGPCQELNPDPSAVLPAVGRCAD
jgi:hypothetical protein